MWYSLEQSDYLIMVSVGRSVLRLWSQEPSTNALSAKNKSLREDKKRLGKRPNCKCGRVCRVTRNIHSSCTRSIEDAKMEVACIGP